MNTVKLAGSTLLLLLASVPLIPSALAAAANVAFGKPVTLEGPFATGSAYFGGGTGGYSLPPASIVTDGLLQGGYWATGVWWDEQHSGTHNYVTVDLEGTYELTEFTVVADNNDRYLLEYRDTDGNWQIAWDIPEACCSGGLTTRATILSSSLTGTALRLSGIFVDTPGHDYAYSVTEIQTSAVPLPPPLLLLITGLAGLGARLRFRAPLRVTLK